MSDLVETGYLDRLREGRRNTYRIKGDRPLRHPVERRVLLPRVAGPAAGLAVKRVVRPGGIVTAKPEMDALGAAADNQPERARLRRRAEEDGDG